MNPTLAECLNLNRSVTEMNPAGVPQACGLGQALLGNVEKALSCADLEN